MSTFDEQLQERTATLNELMQRLNATRQDEAKVLAKISRIKQRTERRRVHKMIVLGSTIWNEYRKFYQISDVEQLRMMDESDEEFVKLAKMIFKKFSENV